MKPSTAMMSYQNPSIDEDVPIVTSIRPPTMMTTGQRSKQMIAIFAAGMMLVAGVVLMQNGGSAYHHLSGSGGITSTVELSVPLSYFESITSPSFNPSTPPLTKQGLVVAPPTKCGSCYGAGKEGECCNTCDEVKAVGDPSLFDFLLLLWPFIY
jgi:hypothetical protein